MVTVCRVRAALVRLLKHPVKLRCRERNGWRIKPNVSFPVRLYECQGIVRVSFLMHHPSSVGIQDWIIFHRVKAGQANYIGGGIAACHE